MRRRLVLIASRCPAAVVTLLSWSTVPSVGCWLVLVAVGSPALVALLSWGVIPFLGRRLVLLAVRGPAVVVLLSWCVCPVVVLYIVSDSTLVIIVGTYCLAVYTRRHLRT